MRIIFLTLVVLVLPVATWAQSAPRATTPDELVLFQTAMRNTSQETERWAYTETTVVKDSKGRVDRDIVVRFDPSKPYADQYTPISISGQEPTEKQRKEYREKGEKRGKSVAKAAEAGRLPGGSPPQVNIGGRKLPLDITHPLVVKDEAGQIIFEVPVLPTRRGIPVEKFQALAQVRKDVPVVEKVMFRVRETFRMKLIASVKAGEVSIDFTVVDPKFGPVVTSMMGNYSASVVFIPVNGTFANTRTDWVRVKPYNERFQVKLAPLEFLDN